MLQIRLRDPEAKGIVERANGYFETSFLPGRAFQPPADFNTQLAGWLERANKRTVWRIAARPVDLIGTDRAAMLTLPPITPTVGIRMRVRLPRDYYVGVDSSDYSVHPDAVGHLVDVSADLADARVTLNGKLVAVHRRSWARRLAVTDPAHQQAALRLRADYRQLGRRRDPDAQSVQLRALPDCDELFDVCLREDAEAVS